MTIVVALKCSDGAVIGSDSMLTVNGFAQQNGQKIHLLEGSPQQLFAFAGDLALAERFRAVATIHVGKLLNVEHKLDYATHIGAVLVQNFQATGLDPFKVSLETVLAFVKNDSPDVCHFNFGSQPRYLDQDHYSVTFGSGSVAAAPFLKFLIDTLLSNRQPNVAEGKLLATWAVKYSIDTLAQGVGYPIDLATIEKDESGTWRLKELGRNDIDETLQAIQSASESLNKWREMFNGNDEINEEIPMPQTSSVNSKNCWGS